MTMLIRNTRNLNCEYRDELNSQMHRLDSTSMPPVLWLVPADVIYDRSVVRITQMESSLILRCNYLGENFNLHDNANRISAIQYAVDDLAVSDIVVYMHSEHRNTHESLRSCNRMRFQHLMQRVQQHLKRLHDHRQFLVENIEMLSNLASVDNALQDGRLEVHGMFYLADSGIHSLYHSETGKFKPLDENWSEISAILKAYRTNTRVCSHE